MPSFLDLSGKRFGRLTVVERSAKPQSKTLTTPWSDSMWRCMCDCGKETHVARGNLKNGSTQSCGCFRNTQGGLSRKHPLWKRWEQMIDRCTNPSSKDFQNYGGRGIKVCERWLSFPLFLEDVEASFVKGTTLDRKNVNGNYEPSNVRWSFLKEQNRNRRDNRLIDTKWGKITIIEAAERSGLPQSRIRRRANRGLTGSRLLRPEKEKPGKKPNSLIPA